MAYTVQTDSSVQQVVSPGDEIWVSAPTIVAVAGAEAFLLNDPGGGSGISTALTVDGSVVSLGDHAMYLSDANDGARLLVSVGAAGVVRGSSARDDFEPTWRGMDLRADEVVVENAGEITGVTGLSMEQPVDGRIVNTGIIAGSTGAGIYTFGAQELFIENHGRISGGGGGVTGNFTKLTLFNTGEIVGGTGSYAIQYYTLGAGDDVRIDNDGAILGGISQTSGDSLLVINSGVVSDLVNEAIDARNLADLRIANTGRLSGGIEGAINATGSDARVLNRGEILGLDEGGPAIDANGGSLVLRNHGLLAGGADAVLGGSDGDLVRNRGAIDGDVDLGGGANTVANLGGAIDGDVTGGAQGDVLRNAGGSIDGTVALGGSADLVRNGGGRITGDVELGGGNDTYRGGRDGVVEGRIQAGDDNDKVYGSSADDTIEGGGGFDLLKGKDGDDVLRGGAGQDTFVGGQGDDEMTGGLLRDEYRFGRRSGDDVITDWSDGEDVLNFRRLNIEITTSVGDVKAASQNRAGGVVIIDLDKLGGDGGIEIHGWNVALMDSSDFIF